MKKKLLYFLLLTLICSACRLTSRLENPRHSSKLVISQAQTRSSKASHSSPASAKERKSNAKEEQVRTKDEVTGEDVVTVAMDEVTVTARSKTIPERFGKVNLDFIITVPQKLIDKRWMIALSPILYRGKEIIKLDDITINGELYRLYQKKGETMFSTLAERYHYFNRDKTHIKDYFYEKYNLGRNTGARLDTIIVSNNSFHYYYSQEIQTDENKKIDLVLSGEIHALDKSGYSLPQSDTITYYISSMVQFIDETPRFIQKVIERHAEANFIAHITFPVGRENIDENLNDNATEIAKVQDIIKQLTWSSEFIIDSINMTASASPEGSWKLNEALAKRRAVSLKSFFAKKMDDKTGVDTLFNAKWIAEDWKRVYKLISEDKRISSKNEILKIITDETDPDKRELLIKKQYPVEYRHIKDSIYPALRVVEFQFNLHRSGMTKDTIHTSEPDTMYAHGIQLLKNRKYKEALAILIERGDYNTAIAYMSLGYDKPAYEILMKEKENANSEYLLAILCARLKDDQEAISHYLRSCQLDESKAWRGALDPEINRLIKAYDLNKDMNLY